VAAAPGQPLDAVQGLVAGGDMLGFEHRRGEHQLHQRARAGHDVGPVGVADGAQRRDRVAHAQVVGGLVGGLLGLHRGQVGQRVAQPFVVAGVGARSPVLQALRHLGQKHPADTALVEQGEQLVERRHGGGFNLIGAQVGHLACRLVGGHALGQAAQVFDQHHAQGGGQRPHLAQVQFARLLVGAQKLHQQIFIERAVGVRHEGPGHAIDARQAGQRLFQQHRQGTKVAVRQALVNFLELRFDQVKVVEQPFGRRADVIAGRRLGSDVAVRLTQRADVASQAREKGRRARGGARRAVGFSEAAAVLCKALEPKNLGAYGRRNHTARTVQDVAQRLRCSGDQTPQLGLRHALQRQRSDTDQQRNHHERRHEARRHEAVHRLADASQREQAATRALAQVQMIPQGRQLDWRGVRRVAKRCGAPGGGGDDVIHECLRPRTPARRESG
jgi:hypothetical protein